MQDMMLSLKIANASLHVCKNEAREEATQLGMYSIPFTFPLGGKFIVNLCSVLFPPPSPLSFNTSFTWGKRKTKKQYLMP